MAENLNVDMLINMINALKNNNPPTEQAEFQPVQKNNNDNLMATLGNVLNSFQTDNQAQNQSGNLNDMLSGILSNLQNPSQSIQNPEPAQNNLGDMLSGMLGNISNTPQNNTNPTDSQENPLSSILQNNSGLMSMLSPMLSNQNSPNNPRSNLLIAAKPFIGASLSPTIDHGIRLVNIAQTTKSALSGLGGLSALTKL